MFDGIDEEIRFQSTAEHTKWMAHLQRCNPRLFALVKLLSTEIEEAVLNNPAKLHPICTCPDSLLALRCTHFGFPTGVVRPTRSRKCTVRRRT